MPISRFSLSLCLMLIIALSPAVMAQPSCNPLGSDTQGMSVDDDADGLIEICTIAGLHAIRHQLDGTGYKATAEGTKVTSGCPANVCKGYELISDLVFSYPDGSAGWEPIGTTASAFDSTFEGNDHTIDNLEINRSANVIGLFGATTSSARIANIGLLNMGVTGNDIVGSLVGFNDGTITNSYAMANVDKEDDVVGDNDVGGLVGRNNGTITNSYVTGNVTGSDNRVGGLVGHNQGPLTNNYATGSVEGDQSVGGLIGENRNAITDSYATGNVVGEDFGIGGLVGTNFSSRITNSYATGNVIGDSVGIGGLVGNNQGPLTNSYATGNVKGNRSGIGGLVGLNNSPITNSYATGNVNGTGTNIGGLVGRNQGSLTNNYATGNVTSVEPFRLGGLVGWNGGTITNNYAIGTVKANSSSSSLGGLVGFNNGGTITSNYWNKETSGQTSSAGSDASAGLTTAQLQSPTAPNATNPNRYTNWNTNDWNFGTASDYPTLKYARGSDTDNPACYPSSDSRSREPVCGTLLLGPNRPPTINTTATVNSKAVAFDDIAEGDTVVLDSRAMSDSGGSLTFLWTEKGSNITSGIDKTKATLQFTVPAAYTGTMKTRTLIFAFSVTGGISTAREQIELTVKRTDNGSITNLVAPTFDSDTTGQLNAPTLSADDDPEGVDQDMITYQWQSCALTCLTNDDWTDITGATQASYTIPSGTAGHTQFRVRIRYLDTQGYPRTLPTASILESEGGVRMRLKLFLEGALQ